MIVQVPNGGRCSRKLSGLSYAETKSPREAAPKYFAS
jgi:hypothetical protein